MCTGTQVKKTQHWHTGQAYLEHVLFGCGFRLDMAWFFSKVLTQKLHCCLEAWTNVHDLDTITFIS